MEEMHRARDVSKDAELPCPLWMDHSPRISMYSSTQKLSEPYAFRDFLF